MRLIIRYTFTGTDRDSESITAQWIRQLARCAENIDWTEYVCDDVVPFVLINFHFGNIGTHTT